MLLHRVDLELHTTGPLAERRPLSGNNGVARRHRAAAVAGALVVGAARVIIRIVAAAAVQHVADDHAELVLLHRALDRADEAALRPLGLAFQMLGALASQSQHKGLVLVPG